MTGDDRAFQDPGGINVRINGVVIRDFAPSDNRILNDPLFDGCGYEARLWRLCE